MKQIVIILLLHFGLTAVMPAQNEDSGNPNIQRFDYFADTVPKCPGTEILFILKGSQYNIHYTLVRDYNGKNECRMKELFGAGDNITILIPNNWGGNYTLVANYGKPGETPMNKPWNVRRLPIPDTSITVQAEPVCDGKPGKITLLNPQTGVNYRLYEYEDFHFENGILLLPPDYLNTDRNIYHIKARDTNGCESILTQPARIIVQPDY